MKSSLEFHSKQALKIKNNFAKLLPSFDQIICWTSLVLDGNFTTFILTSESKCIEALHELHTQIKAQLELANALEPLRGWLLHILHKKPTPKRTNQSYGIELYAI